MDLKPIKIENQNELIILMMHGKDEKFIKTNQYLKVKNTFTAIEKAHRSSDFAKIALDIPKALIKRVFGKI